MRAVWEETGVTSVLQIRPTKRRDGGHMANKRAARKPPSRLLDHAMRQGDEVAPLPSAIGGAGTNPGRTGTPGRKGRSHIWGRAHNLNFRQTRAKEDLRSTG